LATPRSADEVRNFLVKNVENDAGAAE